MAHVLEKARLMATTRRWLFIITCSCLVATLAFTATMVLQSIYRTWMTGRLVSQLASIDDSERDEALQDLRNRNLDVRPLLIPLLKHKSVYVRRFAARSLSDEIPVTDNVVDAQIVVATDETEDENVRFFACLTFRKVGQQAHKSPTNIETKVIGALTGLLKSSNEDVAANAASVLGEFGPAAASAKSDLTAALMTGSESSRLYVADALLAICPDEHTLILPVLLEILHGHDKVASEGAICVLGLIGPDASSAIPALEAVVTENPDLSSRAKEAIDRIRTEGREGELTK